MRKPTFFFAMWVGSTIVARTVYNALTSGPLLDHLGAVITGALAAGLGVLVLGFERRRASAHAEITACASAAIFLSLLLWVELAS